MTYPWRTKHDQDLNREDIAEMRKAAIRAEARVSELSNAVDDLWGCIAKAEIEDLQPETVELAKANHKRLWHS